MPPRYRQIWNVTRTVILVWLGLAAARAGYLALVMDQGTGADLARPFILLAPWMAFTPAIVWLSVQSAGARGGLRVLWAGIHLIAAFGVAAIASRWTLHIWVDEMGRPPLPYLSWFAGQLDALLFMYVAVAGTALAAHLFQRSRAQHEETRRLVADLRQARQHALLLQLQPHFVFNSLNAVAELVHRDPAAARKALANLRMLAERCGDGALPPRIPLKEELAALQAYIEVEQLRFGDVLAVRFRIDPTAETAEVPPFVLQPIVENAIRHGLRKRGSGVIEVVARREGESLHLEVTDDGAGLQEYQRSAEGMGLGLTRTRLDQLFGTGYSLALIGDPGGGAIVRLVIPTGDGSDLVRPALSVSEIRQLSTWRLVRTALVILAGWTLIGILSAQVQMGGDSIAAALRLAPSDIYRSNILNAWLWALITPAVLLVAWHATLKQYPAGRLLSLHLGVLGVSLLFRFLAAPLLGLEPWPRGGIELQSILLRGFYSYAFLAAVCHAWALGERNRIQRMEIGDLRVRVQQAEQEKDRSIDPGLMTTELERIGLLTQHDPGEADRALEQLGSRLRRTLSAGRERQEQPANAPTLAHSNSGRRADGHPSAPAHAPGRSSR